MLHLLPTFLADASGTIKTGVDGACGTGATSACNTTDISHIFSTVTNGLIYVIGAIAVIMVIVGGLRYVLSSGDSKAAGDAKNTILYAVVGVIVSILAYAIVHFAVSSFGS